MNEWLGGWIDERRSYIEKSMDRYANGWMHEIYYWTNHSRSSIRRIHVAGA